MPSYRFKSVCIEAFAPHFPDEEVTSAAIEDRLAPLYQRLQIPFGTLEKLSGIQTRYLWDRSILPSAVSTIAAKKVLENLPFDKSEIKAVINCSVTRDYFEPATACIVHRNLGLGDDAVVMDISNACIGFSDGLLSLATLIETGVVRAGLLVSGENVSRIVNSSSDLLARDKSVTRDDLLKILPTFTLGCGAVAYVLCHESLSKTKHRILGAVARTATEYSDLCNGNGDYNMSQQDDGMPLMHTESSKLISSAAKVGGITWREASPLLGWSKDDVDHIYCHQVGRQVNDAFYREMGLDFKKEFTIYRKYGNLVSAALPSALALGAEQKGMRPGEKVLLTAFGSGLNCRFIGIEW